MSTNTENISHQRIFLTRMHRFVAAFGVALLAILGAVSATPPAHAIPAGVLSGTVTAEDTGQRLQHVWIYLDSVDTGFREPGAQTDEFGQYRFDTVSADGDYTLYISGYNTTGNYASEYYPRTRFRLNAEHVALSNSTETTLNFTLTRGGGIEGTVTFDGPPQATGVQISAYDTTNSSWMFVTAAVVDTSDGSYSAEHLLPGQYIVAFYDPHSTGTYLDEFYTDKYLRDDANLVNVAAMETTTGIDVELSAIRATVVTRLAGANRFQTSASIAAKYASASMVFVANGLGYADALSAAPAAALKGAPLLLTARDYLPAEVKAQIQRLHPEYIWVIGGTGVVSEAVFNELKPLGTDVFRAEGSNRYATSLEVVKTFWPNASTNDLFLADGRNFPDALSAASGAAKSYGPVALVNGGLGSLPTPLGDYLSLGVDNVWIAGGAAVLSDGIKSSTAANPGVDSVQRLWGGNRYATSLAINQEFFSPITDTVYLAVGTGYADALAGAPLAGKSGSPLYLVPGNCVPNDVLTEFVRLGIQKVVLLGGTGVLSPAVEALTPCS